MEKPIETLPQLEIALSQAKAALMRLMYSSRITSVSAKLIVTEEVIKKYSTRYMVAYSTTVDGLKCLYAASPDIQIEIVSPIEQTVQSN